MLLVAMLLAAVITISLGTYMNLSITSLRLADRTFYSNAAMNLVEMGVEEAMWSFQEDDISGTGWNGWDTSSGTTAKRTFGTNTFGGNVTGVTKVYVNDHTGLSASPFILSRSIITLPQGASIEKWILITLNRRSKFNMALVSKGNITFSGTNASVDSWNSDPTGTGSPLVPYSAGVATDEGSIGSIDVSSTISVNNADIWGTAAVGGPATTAIAVGPNGVVGPYGTAAGTKDPGSISTDFTANLDPVAAPTGGTVIGAITGSTTLGAGIWRIPSISLGGGNTLTITGNVTIIITGAEGTSGISIGGTAQFDIAAGANVKIYSAANIDIGGSGVLNPNAQPSTLQIWGTSTNPIAQTIAIKGNGTLAGLVYAPNANVTVNGNGSVNGSIIAKNVTIAGNAAIHFDEALHGLDTGDPYGITKWTELTTAAQRAAYLSLMSF
ncbi:MAG: hypothetical protein K9M98_14770 [Cephaloticoccus sp.]|nr:hypothetical protein [Cephaloticoccus sp.]MCF7761760.1 hypothetical protein [Cephaloticoccus sp.]